jgi:NADPH:quinone reductase-like Zn-dependent oxidoreductase
MAAMTDVDLPTTIRELRSTVSDDGDVVLAIHEAELTAPGDQEVVVRVEAAPINPSDLGMMFAGAGFDDATAVERNGHPGVLAHLPRGAFRAAAARIGVPMPTGNEGGGTVVAAGSSDEAQALLGRTVGFLSGNAYAEYRTVPASSCLAMADGTDPEDAAAAFVNPLTALGMVETMRAEGHTALVHTVGASNLGQMLNRICRADGVGLVNIVRSQEQVDLLREMGAEHVVNSGDDGFTDDLTDALRATGATIAFDAIGGGDQAGTILHCMERVASEGARFSRYGSDTHKQVYVYGSLDPGPTTIRRTFGFAWSIGGWLLTPFLMGLDDAGRERLRSRVADEITTTFASSYGMRVTLDQVVDPDTVRRYGRMATGEKALVTPHA